MRAILIFLLTINCAYAISVEEAYKNIPHQQTTYKASLSNSKDAKVLERLFELVDLAIVQKVESSNYIKKQGGTTYQGYQQKTTAIINAINSLNLENKIKTLISAAIEEQSQFLKKQNLNFCCRLVGRDFGVLPPVWLWGRADHQAQLLVEPARELALAVAGELFPLAGGRGCHIEAFGQSAIDHIAPLRPQETQTGPSPKST